jgi:hypothetical protein
MAAAASILVQKQDADAFEAEDNTDDRFSIAGKVRAGVLEYVIVTKILSTKEQSLIPAEDFFNAMMNHFASKGTTVHTISDEWSELDPELRTQLDRFNRNILSGGYGGGRGQQIIYWKNGSAIGFHQHFCPDVAPSRDKGPLQGGACGF